MSHSYIHTYSYLYALTFIRTHAHSNIPVTCRRIALNVHACSRKTSNVFIVTLSHACHVRESFSLHAIVWCKSFIVDALLKKVIATSSSHLVNKQKIRVRARLPHLFHSPWTGERHTHYFTLYWCVNTSTMLHTAQEHQSIYSCV